MTLWAEPDDGLVPCTYRKGKRCSHPICADNHRLQESAGMVGPPVARNSDPDTSWEAAESVEHLRQRQLAVIACLRELGPSHDEAWTGHYLRFWSRREWPEQSISGLRTRRSEVAAKGMIKNTGRRASTAAGRGSIIWEVVQ